MAHKIKVRPLFEQKTTDCKKDMVSEVVLNEENVETIDDSQSQNPLDEICSEAIDQAKWYFKTNIAEKENLHHKHRFITGLNKLLFYQLVLGGNVDAVMIILDRTLNQYPILYRCLLEGRKQETDACLAGRTTHANGSTVVVIGAAICLLVMLPVFLILTPIFYAVQYVGNCFVPLKVENKQLPLLFALLSDEVSMVALLYQHNPGILKTKDESANNIFHLLASLSEKDSDIAVKCFQMLVQVFGTSAVREVLLNMRNDDGVNGLEYSVKIGSPLYFTKVVETEGILKTTVLEIGSNRIYDSRKRKENKSKADYFRRQPTSSSSYRVVHYEVTRYETGDVFMDQSNLLTLLCGRELMDMKEEEVCSLENSPLFQNWIHAKIKMNVLPVLLISFWELMMWTFKAVYLSGGIKASSKANLEVQYWKLFDKINSTLQAPLNESACFPSKSSFNYTTDQIKTLTECKISEACGEEIYLPMTSKHSHGSISLLDIVFVATLLLAVIFDCYVRIVFLAIQFLDRTWRMENRLVPLFRRILTKRMQISYASKQLSVSSSFFLIMAFLIYMTTRGLEVVDKESAELKYFYQSHLDRFIVIGICLRVFCLLHSWRIFRMGGHFIISTVKLSRPLLQFSAIYGSVGIMFATLFLFVALDQSCPVQNITPFNTLYGSIFGTFRLMMGDSMFPNEMNDRLFITYACFVIFASIVMMSVLTGISGAIADRVLSPQLKGPLLLQEWLEESINAETMLLLLTLPFRRCFHRWRLMSYARQGNVLKTEDGGVFKVILEVDNLRLKSQF